MDRVRKTFFDPLATTKASVYKLLEDLPIGSAHPFSPENILLCRTETGITEIDISSYPEDFFFNAVDLGEMGEILLRRMAGFNQLNVFADFQIMQAPGATFKISLPGNEITILAVSERTPTYYDFCFANAAQDACCWLARDTFPGISHSGDLLNGKDLLDYVYIHDETLTREEICVFISGYQKTPITQFLGTHPALLVADHVDKILYIVPVPLDKATIGNATICCPLVIKRDENGGHLICSILPTATTDTGKMCHSNQMVSPCFAEAIKRADFTITPSVAATSTSLSGSTATLADLDISLQHEAASKTHAIIATTSTPLPVAKTDGYQVIRFDTGLNFESSKASENKRNSKSTVILPCIFGDLLEGPLLLATGTTPLNTPFKDADTLRSYYEQLESVVVVVDDRMTDNARNLAPVWRINAVFIVHLQKQKPGDAEDLLQTLNAANVNAVTASAGPQSLVLVRIADKFFFYRGIANRALLNTSKLAFGADVTSTVVSCTQLGDLVEPKAKRIIDLRDDNAILLPASGRQAKPMQLPKLFSDLSAQELQEMAEDVAAAVPQLAALLSQKDLAELSKTLVTTLSSKVGDATASARTAYIKFVTGQTDMTDPDFVKQKAKMLGELRKTTQILQKALEPVISSLANMVSSQTSSKRTHDLKRLVREAKIRDNIEATKSMTFETVAGFLEDHASEMGVMLLNIEAGPYQQLLGNLKTSSLVIDATESCNLDNRILHLPGFDAGIIIEQSQNEHHGPLTSQSGPSHPTLALPYLNPSRGSGSMLAWVCWDEFVNLESPYKVRWLEKCNDPHIAAMRIIMRDTLSKATASREHDLQPGSPEIGVMMTSLLMAAMSKLAAMKTSAPVVIQTAEDTVTRLMRGLFANLLTIAGSGVRPLSMVWQLFGLDPSFDVPNNNVDWIWYEKVVALYPYTGWPLKQFYSNLEKVLDKAIIRVVTAGEDTSVLKVNRMAQLVESCRLRNIQLLESRTIITIFMKMLTTKDADVKAIAERLLDHLPHHLKNQSQSYTRMIQYLKVLAQGGERHAVQDSILASVYTKRSAVFADTKNKVADACVKQDWNDAQKECQALMDHHSEIANLWNISPKAFKIQNGKAYESLLQGDFGPEITRQILSDAERTRTPWRVASRGFREATMESLDEVLCHEILTGEKTQTPAIDEGSQQNTTTTAVAVIEPPVDQFASFRSSLQPAFVSKLEKKLSSADVCELMKVSVSAMRVFVKALNPDFVWEDLGQNFLPVVLALLENRSRRQESQPCRKLLEIGAGQELRQIEAPQEL